MEIVKKFDINNWSQKITCDNCTTEFIMKINDFQKNYGDKLYIECPVCKHCDYELEQIQPNFVVQTAASLMGCGCVKF
jgi:predicted Zn-ribbon and HTH transcriptional regulator